MAEKTNDLTVSKMPNEKLPPGIIQDKELFSAALNQAKLPAVELLEEEIFPAVKLPDEHLPPEKLPDDEYSDLPPGKVTDKELFPAAPVEVQPSFKMPVEDLPPAKGPDEESPPAKIIEEKLSPAKTPVVELSPTKVPDKELFFAENMYDEELPAEKTPTPVNNTAQSQWQEFADNTTLHGLHYVFEKRHILFRLAWIVLLLATSSYYALTVYKALNKYFSYPINTVIKYKYNEEMNFPAVTICPLNFFVATKLYMTDNNPKFTSSGLNISSCAVTSRMRRMLGNLPCGLAMLCCCAPPEIVNKTVGVIAYCTDGYKQQLLKTMQNNNHRFDIEDFYRFYSPDIGPLTGHGMCTFGWQVLPCQPNDFVSTVTQWGKCYTFNAGTNGTKVKTMKHNRVSSGLSLMLDAQTSEYYIGKYSEGFKVMIHGQGEYVDEWEGFNVGPGQHAVIAFSQKRFKNLEKPFATNCTKKTLKTFPIYTLQGCLYECMAENIVKECRCRIPGYRGRVCRDIIL